MDASTYITLLHYPVKNKSDDTIVSAVTNLDVHDMARLACTYDLDGFFVVTPLEEQQEFVRELVSHWREGSGGVLNPWRKMAFERIRIAPDLETVCEQIKIKHNVRPIIYATTAATMTGQLSWQETRKKLKKQHTLLLFGTAYGLCPEVLERADGILMPIMAKSTYNHLSVRSAVSITLDRLLGDDDNG